MDEGYDIPKAWIAVEGWNPAKLPGLFPPAPNSFHGRSCSADTTKSFAVKWCKGNSGLRKYASLDDFKAVVMALQIDKPMRCLFNWVGSVLVSDVHNPARVDIPENPRDTSYRGTSENIEK